MEEKIKYLIAVTSKLEKKMLHPTIFVPRTHNSLLNWIGDYIVNNKFKFDRE